MSTKVTKVAAEAAIVDTMQRLCVGDAAFDEVKEGKDNLMVDNKESDKVKVATKESNQVKVLKKELGQIKAVGKERVGEEICGVSKDDNERWGREKSCNVLKEKRSEKKRKKQGKERMHAEYKGFEKVVKNKEPACEEAGLDKTIFNQSNIDCEEFNQVKKVDVIEKKEKRGREKFDKKFARNGHLVSNLIKKVEKTNKKMEKLGRKKEGFVPIVSEGEQWFDASSDLAKAGEGGQAGMEIVQGGFSRVEVKKAEVEWTILFQKGYKRI